jgi:hypothetical protein
VNSSAEIFRLTIVNQHILLVIFQEMEYKPFEGYLDFLRVIFDIISNKDEYSEKAQMLDLVQKLCKHRLVIQFIVEQDLGYVICRYLDKLTTEETCCKLALKAIHACCSMDSEFDKYFLQNNLLGRLGTIMKSTYANDRSNIQYWCVYIIAQLIASQERVSKEARHCAVMECVLNVLILKIHPSVTNVCLDTFRRFIFKASYEEITYFLDKNSEFLEQILKCMTKDQTVKNIQKCLVILNKILGDEREQRADGDWPYYEAILNSDHLDKLEKL